MRRYRAPPSVRRRQNISREHICRNNNPSRRSDNPSRRTDNPSRRDDNPSRRDDNPSRRTDNPSRRADNPSHRTDNPSRRADNPSRGNVNLCCRQRSGPARCRAGCRGGRKVGAGRREGPHASHGSCPSGRRRKTRQDPGREKRRGGGRFRSDVGQPCSTAPKAYAPERAITAPAPRRNSPWNRPAGPKAWRAPAATGPAIRAGRIRRA